MKELPPESQFHIRAAQGWLELGAHLAANEELESMPALHRVHPSVLMIRFDIYAKAERWAACVELAQGILACLPRSAEGLRRAFRAASHIDGSNLEQWWAELMSKLNEHPDAQWLHYDAALAAASLKKTDQAQTLLTKAFSIAEAKGRVAFKEIRLAALDQSKLTEILFDRKQPL